MDGLLKTLQACSHGIWYQPLIDEVDPEPFFRSHRLPIENRLILTQDQRSSPIEQAGHIQTWLGTKQGYILLPGRHFDRHGGRHGRGGGWYDRLLAHLPNDIIRIGVTDSSHLSSTPLSLNPWDQPVDWLLINIGRNWEGHETHARKIKSSIPPDPIGV